jgi:hypothetical protein
MAPLSLVVWIWQRRRPVGARLAGGAPISDGAERSITLWVVMAMIGALVCLAFFFWFASVNSRVHIEVPQTRYLSTTALGILALAAAAAGLLWWAAKDPFLSASRVQPS